MSSTFNIGKVFGIQLRLHYSWFVIFVLLTVSLVFPNWSHPFYWFTGIVTSILFFASVVAHELSHSLVGRVNGIPIKSITLFIFGGVAQMTKEATRPGAEFKMAIAGPVCSLAIGGLFALIWFFTRNVVEPVATMTLWLASINGLLAVFNLIPGFPLDGGRVFRSLLWRFSGNYRRSTKVAAYVGRGVGYFFIFIGVLIIFLRPFGLDWFSGLWLAFIGWFLENAASASYRQSIIYEMLQGVTITQVMTSDYVVVPPHITLDQLVQEYILTRGRHFFLVADEDGIKGLVTLRNIKPVLQQNWDKTQVKDIMTPVDKLKMAYPGQDALSVMEQMSESDINQMPVVSDGKVIGLVTRDNLTGFLRTRSRLGI